jgi:phosphate acetyltransferase
MPEGEEERVINAASILSRQKFVTPVLIGNPEKINSLARHLKVDISTIDIRDPQTSPFSGSWAEKFYELRKHKNMTQEQAAQTIKNPLFLGAFMVREGLADGAVAGSDPLVP